MIKVTRQLVQKCFHKRPINSNKFENGRVLVVGGNEDYVGAPVLAALSAKAALRTGAGISYLAAPEKVGFAASAYSPDLIVYKLKGTHFSKKHLKSVLEYSKKVDVVVIGNGLGLHKDTVSFVKEFVKKVSVPLVIDADGIKAVKGMIFDKPVLLTPHAREFEIFCGKKLVDPKMHVKEVAKKHNCVILLKGKTDYISGGEKVYSSQTGNSGMAVAGTGDVLAGVCAAFVSHKNSLIHSACSGAFVCGLVGDRLLKKKGVGFIASDFVDEILFVTKSFWSKAK